MARTPKTPSTEEDAKYRAMHDLYSAIGAVASAWAAFEAEIDIAALQLAGLEEFTIAVCFTAQILGSARKLDAYIAVARERGTKLTAELEYFAKKTNPLAERRNRIVHDPWVVFSPEESHRFEMTARRKLRLLLVDMPRSDILKCYRDILSHRTDFRALHAKIQNEVGT